MATIRYFVDNIEESIAFYTQRLGFSLEKQFGPFAIVSKADLTLWLSDSRTSAARPMLDTRMASLVAADSFSSISDASDTG